MSYYQQDMLSITSRTLVANILAEVVLLSQAVEVFREDLAQIPFFDSIALFRYLDEEEKGFLSQKDFQRVVGTSHRKLLTYAFTWFDTMKVGEISRLEFAAFLLPKDNLQLRELVARKVQHPTEEQNQQQTILAQVQVFSRLLTQMMNRQMKIIELRRKLLQCEDYSIKAALTAIDAHQHRVLCGEDLYNYLKNFGFDITLRHIQKLIQSINSSLDGKITEEQLRWTIEGFENKNKSYLQKIKDSNKRLKQRGSSAKKTIQEGPDRITQQFRLPSQFSQSELTQLYRLLQSKFKAAQKEQQQMDQLLKTEQAEIVKSIDKECEHFLADLSARTRLQQQQKNEMTCGTYLANGSDQRKLMKTENERRARERVQRKIRERVLGQGDRSKEQAYLDQLKLRTSYLMHAYDSQMVGSDCRLSPGKYSHYITSSPLKKDYTNLTHLSRLTQVESHVKGSSRIHNPSFPIDHHSFPSSNAYLEEIDRLKQVIRKERQVEKQIQRRLSSSKYDTAKYSGSYPQPLHRIREFTEHEEEAKDNQISFSKGTASPNKQFESTGSNRFEYQTNTSQQR